MRKCAQCGVADREVPADGGEPEHLVKPLLRWLGKDEPVTPRELAMGWTERTWQGKRAKERMLCTDCINANVGRDAVWRKMRADARRLEHPEAAGSYFVDLCESW